MTKASGADVARLCETGRATRGFRSVGRRGWKDLQVLVALMEVDGPAATQDLARSVLCGKPAGGRMGACGKVDSRASALPPDGRPHRRKHPSPAGWLPLEVL